MARPTRFEAEEWEEWMKWDGPMESLSPKSPISFSPPPLQFVSGSIGSTSPSELESLAPIQTSPTYQLPTTESRKRKSAAITAGPAASGRQARGKKTSHNVIEKRYRSNLNDKIARLRDSVPELRTSQGPVRRRPHKAAGTDSEGSGDEDASSGLKFNKATVLTKATEYIQQLERQNQRLLAEVNQLRTSGGSDPRNPPPIYTGVHRATGVSGHYSITKSTTAPIEQSTGEASVVTKRAASPAGMIGIPESMRRLREETSPQAHYAPESSDPNTNSPPPIPFSEVRGLLPIPEEFRRFREQAAQSSSQEHYAPTSSSFAPNLQPSSEALDFDNDDDEKSHWSKKTRAMSRILIGSLAGLMVMEGFNEKEVSSSSSQSLRSRGLFSLPTELLTESRGFRAQIRQRIIDFAASPQATRAMPILLLSFVFFAVCFAVFLYLIPSESKAVREGGPATLQIQQTAAESRTLTFPLPSRSSAEHPPPSWPPDPRSSSLHVHLGPGQSGESLLVSMLDYCAKQAVSWLGFSWLGWYHHDEEAAGRTPLGRREEYGKRWRAYSRLLPRLLDESEGG